MAQSTKDSITLPKTHTHIMMTQLNVQEGLKAYGEKGDEAIMKEVSQLHTRKALLPCSRNDMTYDERKKALRYLMFLKEKRDGSIKARECADGRPQCIYTNKEDASSPTMSIEAMVLSCAIEAKESRYVVVSDIPGAFLHADMEENVHMLLEGTVAEMIVKQDPLMYKKHIWYNKKGKPMMYVQLKKAMYKTLQAALLFWKLLMETLKEWGFVLNPYDKCVANKIIAGKQCTILWHVDNLKISHVDKAVVEDILKKLNTKFGKSPYHKSHKSTGLPWYEDRLLTKRQSKIYNVRIH